MCGSELTLVDLVVGDVVILRNTDVTVLQNNITFTGERLTTNRRYNITVRAYNIAGSASSYTTLSE